MHLKIIILFSIRMNYSRLQVIDIIQQYFVVTNVNAASSPSADPAAGSRWGLMQRNSALTRLDAPLCATIYHMPGVHCL